MLSVLPSVESTSCFTAWQVFEIPSAWLQSSRYLKSPFPKDYAIIRLARKWFVRGVFRAATVRERSSDCRPTIYREFVQPTTSYCDRPSLSIAKKASGMPPE